MEKLAAMMAFCEAPLDGTLAPSGAAEYYDASATGGYSKLVALLDAAAKELPVERLVATMAFCEAPFDGTLDSTTSAPSSLGAAGGSSASATNVRGAGAAGEDAKALRRAGVAGRLQEGVVVAGKTGRTIVDGPAIFETVALD